MCEACSMLWADQAQVSLLFYRGHSRRQLSSWTIRILLMWGLGRYKRGSVHLSICIWRSTRYAPEGTRPGYSTITSQLWFRKQRMTPSPTISWSGWAVWVRHAEHLVSDVSQRSETVVKLEDLSTIVNSKHKAGSACKDLAATGTEFRDEPFQQRVGLLVAL